MSTINFAQADVSGNLLYRWSPLAAGDEGTPVIHPGTADRSVQVTGAFNGASALLEGSLDGSNWFTLRDVQGVSLSFTAPGLRAVLENAAYVRPRVAGGDIGTDLVVIVNIRR